MNAIENHDPKVIEAVNNKIRTIQASWMIIINRLEFRKHPKTTPFIAVEEEQQPV